MAEENKGNQVVLLDQQIKEATSVMDLLTKPDIRSRAISGYVSMTGKKDGDTRFNNERAAYLEKINEFPDLRAAPYFSHFKAFNKVMHSGLSLRDGKLYMQAIKKDGVVVDIKVDSSPAGKREMFLLMPTIKDVPEGEVVLRGDIFLQDLLTKQITKHERTEKSMAADKLENIMYSYQRLIYKDGTIKDVVVPQHALFKARAKSKVKDPENAGVWLFPDEASKKTAMNRAFRLYHMYPDRSMVLDQEEEETNDTDHQDVTSTYQEPEQLEQRTDVDLTTGEELKPEQQVEPVVTKQKKNLLAE